MSGDTEKANTVSVSDNIARLISTAANDVTIARDGLSPSLRGPRSTDMTPRKSSLVTTPRSLNNSYSGKKRAVSFNASNTFLAAQHALEDRVDLFSTEPDSVNQTITQCSIPEEEETISRSRMSFAHLDQSSLKVEELHTSGKALSVDDLFSKLMTLQRHNDSDPELSKHDLSSIPIGQPMAIKKDFSEKGSESSSSIKLEPFLTVEAQQQHHLLFDRSVELANVCIDTKQYSKEPKQIDSPDAYEPLAMITTIEVVQQSAGVKFSNKSNFSNKSDLSVISDATDLTEIWDNKEPIEPSVVKPKKKKKGVRMQFADDVDIINAFNESPDPLDSPVVVEVTQPAGVKPSRPSFEISQLSGANELNDELLTAQRNRVSSIRLPPMSNSAKTSSNDNGGNNEKLSSLMVDVKSPPDGVRETGGFRLGIAGVSSKSATAAAAGGSFGSNKGNHQGYEDKTAELSPNETFSLNNNSRPPFPKQNHHSTNSQDDDPSNPLVPSSAAGGEGSTRFLCGGGSSTSISIAVKKKPKPAGNGGSTSTLAPLSATQFRRHERENRHLTVAIDLARGVESYSLTKLSMNIFVVWFALPLVLCIVVYGIIPYDYFTVDGTVINNIRRLRGLRDNTVVNNVSGYAWAATIIPWALIMPAAASLAVECYSNIISEIEFSVIIWEDTPHEYAQASIVATLTAMILQVIVFAVGGAGYSRSWLVMMCGGVVGLTSVLGWMFSRSRRNVHGGDSSKEYVEAKGVFFQCVMGYCTLVLFASVMYAVFALIFSQFRTVGNGAVGIVLAAGYPLLRLALARGVELAQPTRWGYGRGQLCAGVQATVIATAWHAAFLSLIAGCIATQFELLLMAVVDTTITASAMIVIDRLPRAQKRAESTTNVLRRLSRSMSAFSLLVQYRVVVTDDGQVLVDGHPTQSTRRGPHQTPQVTHSPTESHSGESAKQQPKPSPFGESNKQQLQLTRPPPQDAASSSTIPHPPGWSVSPRNPYLNSIGDALHKKYEPPKEDDDGDVVPVPTRHDMRPTPNTATPVPLPNNQSAKDNIIGQSAKSASINNSNSNSVGGSHKSIGSVGPLDPNASSRRSSIFSSPYLLFNSLTRSSSILEQEAQTPSRTFEDDAREVRIATWLGLTWLTGAIFPLVFLLCALVFSAGPNRRLFGADPSDLPSSWELATGQHRLWSLNVFQQSAQLGWSGSGTVHVADSSNMWVNAASSGGAISVWRLLGISVYHCLLLGGGVYWFHWRGTPEAEVIYLEKKRESSKNRSSVKSIDSSTNSDDDDVPFTDRGVSRDVWGLLSALLEHHTTVVALAMILSLSVVFSVVLPWYGMNNMM